MEGRSTIEAINLIRRLIEFFKDRKIDLHMMFFDLGKIYDKVPREVLWNCLTKNILFDYIRTISDMYERGRTRMKTIREIQSFCIDIGLHQGSTLSSFVFNIIIHELMKDI